MHFHLTHQPIHRQPVLLITGLAVYFEEHLPRVDVINVIGLYPVEVNLTPVIDQCIGPLDHIIEILAVVGLPPHL